MVSVEYWIPLVRHILLLYHSLTLFYLCLQDHQPALPNACTANPACPLCLSPPTPLCSNPGIKPFWTIPHCFLSLCWALGSTTATPVSTMAHHSYLKFTKFKFVNIWKCCGQMRPKLNSLVSTQLAVFGGGWMLPPQEHHPQRQTQRWKHYALGVFFC